MKPVSKIRRERLAELVRQAGSQVAVAETIRKDKNQIHQWLLPEGVDGARNMGNASARAIETAFNKPYGWMDTAAEPFSSSSEQSPTLYNGQSYAVGLSPATIKTVHEMLRWRFDYEGQHYSVEAMPELFSLAYQAAISGSDSDKAALKAAVDQALLKGKENAADRRDEAPVERARPSTAKRGGTRA